MGYLEFPNVFQQISKGKYFYFQHVLYVFVFTNLKHSFLPLLNRKNHVTSYQQQKSSHLLRNPLVHGH